MRRMLHPAPFATIDHIQVVQPFMQRVAKGTVKIAVELIAAAVTHAPTVLKSRGGIYRYSISSDFRHRAICHSRKPGSLAEMTQETGLLS
jgi:hypothetical protein